MRDKTDLTADVAGVCLALLLASMVIAFAYAWGVHIGEMNPREVHVPIHSGMPREMVPVWAVENREGVLTGCSAMLGTDGVFREFNVFGGPVLHEPLPEPWRWMELNAAFSQEP